MRIAKAGCDWVATSGGIDAGIQAVRDPGNVVTITGCGFGEARGAGTVIFDATPAQDIL